MSGGVRGMSDQRVESIATTARGTLRNTAGGSVVDEGAALRVLASVIMAAWAHAPELDRAVRQRIESLSRQVPEGSSEWDLLYRQYSEELAKRR